MKDSPQPEGGPFEDPMEFSVDHGIDPAVFARRWWSLGVLCLSLLIIMIGNTSLNVAIPRLSEELHSTNSQLQWMVSGYSLVFAGLLFTAGNFGDRYGRKGILQAGLVVFGLATAYAAFWANSSTDLIVARVVMGAGAAMVMPATLSIITNIFPTHERAKAVALWAGISGAGSALGPLVSGFALEHWGWPSVFLINIPVIILALILGAMLVPQSKGETGTPLDLLGAVLSSIGLALLVYSLIEAPRFGWVSIQTMGVGTAGVVILLAFILHELRIEHPMLEVRLFRIRSFGVSSLVLTMVFFALMGTFFSLTQLLQLVWDYTALEAAVRLLPISFFMMLSAPQSARLAEKFGKSRVVGTGMGCVAVGILIISRVGVGADYWLMVGGASVMATGMGLAMAPTTDLLMSSVPRMNAGMGSAMNDTTRELGASLGVAIFGSLLASKYVNGLGDLLGRVPEAYRADVKASLGGAVEVAKGMKKQGVSADLVDQYMGTVKQAWVEGLRLSLLIAGLIVLAASAVAFLFLPNKAADVEELEHAVEHDHTTHSV